MAGNKNVLLCVLENEGQGYHLQKLLYFTYNTKVFVAGNKKCHINKDKVVQQPPSRRIFCRAQEPVS